jgi:hypothetical protein
MSTVATTAPGEFQDPALLSLMDLYRQVVAQRYTAGGPTDLVRLLAVPPYFVSRKFDGELWFLVSTSEGQMLVAANGRIASGDVPVLSAHKLPQGTVLVGELYVPNEARERVGDVQSALAAGGEKLAFGAFDVLQNGDATWREISVTQRHDLLLTLLPESGPIHRIPVTTVESEAEVVALYDEYVETAGAEGIVVRCSDGRALKVKPETSIDLAILGFTQRDGTAGPEVRSLLIGLSAGDDTWIPVGTVGNFNDAVDRQALLSALEPLIVSSNYRRAASTGQLYRMTQPQILIECRVLDVQVEDSRGRAIRQPLLKVEESGSLQVTGNVASASLLNPVAVRLRDDKPSAEEGARWQQIAHLIAISDTGREAIPSSTITRRQVWTKVSKDKTDVRKLVVWKTHKETIDSSYPAYVVHWTDYSAGRKAPLSREVRPAPDEVAANALADALIAENIKKGWQEHP